MASEQDSQDWLAPSRDYVSPSSGFFFAPGVEKTSLMAYLPSRSMVNRLIEHYWEAVHVLAKIVHRPSFERQLARFWDNFQQGIEPRASFQAIVFATLLTSITSMSEDRECLLSLEWTSVILSTISDKALKPHWRRPTFYILPSWKQCKHLSCIW
jgi:hypothetical protein